MELTIRPDRNRHRSPWFPAGKGGRAALAGLAALVAVSVIALVALDTSSTGGGPIALPGTFTPFTAEVLSTTEASTERSQLTWQNFQNWRLDTFDPANPSRVISSQHVVSGSLTIMKAGFGETHFPEVTDRVPGEWFVTSGTALGRGGVRVPGKRPVIRQTVSRPCDQLMAQVCGNRTSIEEVTEYEFHPDTGLPIRYTVVLDGKIIKEVKLDNIRPL